jgi:hypothetical protein
MKRPNKFNLRLSDSELATLAAAAEITHPTSKGGNTARAIREAALSAARAVLAIDIKLSGSYRGVSGANYWIVIDPTDRDVSDYAAVGNGIPMHAFHHHTRMLPVNNNVVGAELLAMLRGEEAQEIIAGIIGHWQGKEWNGSNHVGIWSADEHGGPAKALEALEHQLSELLAAVPVYADADDYVGNWLSWENFDEAETLSAVVAEWITDARADGVWLVAEEVTAVLTEWLTNRRDELRDEDELDEEDSERLALAERLLA